MLNDTHSSSPSPGPRPYPQLCPDNPTLQAHLHSNLAACRMASGDLTTAAADCDRALAINPRHCKARLRRARIALSQQRWDDCLADFAAVVKEMDTAAGGGGRKGGRGATAAVVTPCPLALPEGTLAEVRAELAEARAAKEKAAAEAAARAREADAARKAAEPAPAAGDAARKPADPPRADTTRKAKDAGAAAAASGAGGGGGKGKKGKRKGGKAKGGSKAGPAGGGGAGASGRRAGAAGGGMGMGGGGRSGPGVYVFGPGGFYFVPEGDDDEDLEGHYEGYDDEYDDGGYYEDGEPYEDDDEFGGYGGPGGFRNAGFNDADFFFRFVFGGGFFAGMPGGAGGGPRRSDIDDEATDPTVDHFAVLGVAADASELEVRRAYLQLSKFHHPDKGGDAEVFKSVSTAYQVLSDPDRRRAHAAEVARRGGAAGRRR